MANQKGLQDAVDFYMLRYAYQDPSLEEPPHPETKTILVIPCYNEPAMLETLDSLKNCTPPDYPIEIIIVVNASTEAEPEIIDQNHQTIGQVLQWRKTSQPQYMQIHLLVHNALPYKDAGVGLARKIGMDEAASRFSSINVNGSIICLDADCTVEKNYLKEIEQKFSLNQEKDLLGIYFEHQIEAIEEQPLREGIIYYELFLRYYVNGLKWAGYPFAWHTIGSSMGVKPKLYAIQGGMNKRKAAEDFYFMHKMAPHARYLNLTTTTVYPSPRISDRVPFGTGKAQGDWQKGNNKYAYGYHPEVFKALGELMQTLPSLYQALDTDHSDIIIGQLPEMVWAYLNENQFDEALERICNSVNSFEAFQKKMHAWLDGFRVLKLIHYLRDHYLPNEKLEEAAKTVLSYLNKSLSKEKTMPEDLLKIYREMDRSEGN